MDESFDYGVNCPEQIDFSDANFQFKLTLECSNGIEEWYEYVTYNVTYEMLDQGLIVYDFTRTAKKVKKNKRKRDDESNSGSGEGTGTGENTETGSGDGTGEGDDTSSQDTENTDDNTSDDENNDNDIPWWLPWWLRWLLGGGSGGNTGSGDNSDSGSSKPTITQSPGGKQDNQAAIVIAVGTVSTVTARTVIALSILSRSEYPSLRVWRDALALVPGAVVIINANGMVVHAEDGNDYYVLPDTSQNRTQIEIIQDAELILESLDMTDGAEGYDEDEIEDKIKEKDKEFRDAETQVPQRDPLIIRYTENDDEFLTDLENGVNFDLDNNGFDEKTAWIGEADCFLALDVNGNGKIDNGFELFGDRFVMPNGNTSSTGFEALASLDANGDTIIDENDPIFPELRVWFDSNHNGKTDIGELRTLSDEHIVSIDLNSTPDGTVHARTEVLEAESSNVTYEDTTTRKISEFWFPINSADTTHEGIATVGNVPNLLQALEDDEDDYLTYLCDEFNNSPDIFTKRYYLKRILYVITEAEDIIADSRGGNIDAHDLSWVESLWE